MSAEHMADRADWVVPEGGFTATDLDWLGLPPHTELIDGGLFFVSPQKAFHTEVNYLLQVGLRASAPLTLHVTREMSVVLGERHRPEPDILVIDVDFRGDGSETWYPASAVRLVVEVTSPESVDRDRSRKPQLYAQAGIPHFWRVEENDGKPVVYVYELDPSTSGYVLSGIHHERLQLAVPYAIDIDFGNLK